MVLKYIPTCLVDFCYQASKVVKGDIRPVHFPLRHFQGLDGYHDLSLESAQMISNGVLRLKKKKRKKKVNGSLGAFG